MCHTHDTTMSHDNVRLLSIGEEEKLLLQKCALNEIITF